MMMTKGLIIVVGVVVALLVIGSLAKHFNKKKKLPNEHEQPSLDLDDEIIIEDHESLITPSVGVLLDTNTEAEVAPTVQFSQTDDILAISVMAEEEHKFSGYELLQSLLSAGFRYGDMNIFHRYESLNTPSKLLFSLASATEPGTFDINNMGAFACHGLTMFMRLDAERDDATVFELMLGTARQLAEDLGGELRNERRESLSQEVIRDYRERIRTFHQQHANAEVIS